MANELSLTVALTYTPSETNQVKVSPPDFTDVVTMSGTDFATGTQEIGTSEEAVVGLDASGNLGYALLKNLDTTNYVEINADTGWTKATIKLKAGEFALFRVGDTTTAIRAQADTAAVRVQYYLFED